MTDSAALRHRPLVFVDDLDSPRIGADDLHHLERVLRLSRGEPITVGDGAGGWQEARFDEIPATVGERRLSPPPDSTVTIAFTPVKGTRPEWVVQKLTELGVDRILPVLSERSVVRWDEAKSARNRERMQVVAREAAMQSRRVRLPVVESLVPLAVFLAEHRGAVLADPEGRAPWSTTSTITIGPEGGFSPDELAGRELVALPGGVLRAETAAVVAASVACGIRAGLLTAPKE